MLTRLRSALILQTAMFSYVPNSSASHPVELRSLESERMFLLHRPDRSRIATFLDRQKESPFSYDDVGATLRVPPTHFAVDRYRVRLGQGSRVFGRAVDAVNRWAMFDTGWTHICWPETAVKKDNVVCSLMCHLGFWSLNACRIVYVIEDTSVGADGIVRYGFAYGTLRDHAERGEERFSVEYHTADSSVWYDVVAFSKPAHLLTMAGYPIARGLQKRFRRDSIRAMERAVAASE